MTEQSQYEPDNAARTGRTGQGQPEPCPVCGGALPSAAQLEGHEAPVARYCPRCGAPVGGRDTVMSAVSFEQKTLLCPPHELEQLTRSEAVDGWYLLDTTVSEAVPGLIEAHFRRPQRSQPSDPGSVEPAQAGAATAKPRLRTDRGPPGPEPRRPPPEPAEEALGRTRSSRRPRRSKRRVEAGAHPVSHGLVTIMTWLVIFVVIAAVLEEASWLALLVILLALPKLLRALGSGRRGRGG